VRFKKQSALYLKQMKFLIKIRKNTFFEVHTILKMVNCKAILFIFGLKD